MSAIWWTAKFLWYFWTFTLSLPLLLMPGATREFVKRRWHALVWLGEEWP